MVSGLSGNRGGNGVGSVDAERNVQNREAPEGRALPFGSGFMKKRGGQGGGDCLERWDFGLAKEIARVEQAARDFENLAAVQKQYDDLAAADAAVRAFLAARGATGRMYYLLGERRQLMPVWKAWKVGVSAGRHGYTTGHSDIVYGITASGRIAVVYPPNFTPAQIIHDVPVLARS